MGIFRWIFSTFMAAWNTNALDNFMVSKLFKVKKQTSDEDNSCGKLERSKWPHCGAYLCSWVPSPIKNGYCKKKDKAKAMGLARTKLSMEMNQVQLLKH